MLLVLFMLVPFQIFTLEQIICLINLTFYGCFCFIEMSLSGNIECMKRKEKIHFFEKRLVFLKIEWAVVGPLRTWRFRFKLDNFFVTLILFNLMCS